MRAPSHGYFEIPIVEKVCSRFYVVRYNTEREEWEVLLTPTFTNKEECLVYIAEMNKKFGDVDIKG